MQWRAVVWKPSSSFHSVCFGEYVLPRLQFSCSTFPSNCISANMFWLPTGVWLVHFYFFLFSLQHFLFLTVQALNLRLIGRLDPDGTRLWKNMRKSGNGMLQTIYMAFTDGDGDGMTWCQLLYDVSKKPVLSIVSWAFSENKDIDWGWEEGSIVTFE